MNARTVKSLIIWNLTVTGLLLVAVAQHAGWAQAANDPPAKVVTIQENAAGQDTGVTLNAPDITAATHSTIVSVAVTINGTGNYVCAFNATAQVVRSGDLSGIYKISLYQGSLRMPESERVHEFVNNQAGINDFLITVKTDNPGTSSTTQFTVPTAGGGYNYNVDCNNNGSLEATAQTGNYTCNYHVAETVTIRIEDNSGAGTGFPRIYFNNGGDRLKLLTIDQWGTGKWTSMNSAFSGCANLGGRQTTAPTSLA
jgi:hypothetical protein